MEMYILNGISIILFMISVTFNLWIQSKVNKLVSERLSDLENNEY